MKKLFAILSVVLISTSLMAQTNQSDFIKTHDGTFFFKKIKNDKANNFIGIKQNGEKVEFNKEDVDAYVIKGEYSQKMPVYENNVLTGENDFMKVLESKKGMILLEYKHVSKASGKKETKYYVFKNDKFVVEMDDKNEGTLTAFFGGY